MVKFVILYFGFDEVDVLMICDSESDAYEMALSFAQERMYENWYEETQIYGYSDIKDYKIAEDEWYYDYFVLEAPYYPNLVKEK